LAIKHDPTLFDDRTFSGLNTLFNPALSSHLSAFYEDKRATAILLHHDEIDLLRLELAKHVARMYMKCMRLGSSKCKAVSKGEVLGDHCLGTKYVDVVQSGQTISNMFDHRPNEQKCFTMFDQMFDVFHISSNTRSNTITNTIFYYYSAYNNRTKQSIG